MVDETADETADEGPTTRKWTREAIETYAMGHFANAYKWLPSVKAVTFGDTGQASPHHSKKLAVGYLIKDFGRKDTVWIHMTNLHEFDYFSEGSTRKVSRQQCDKIILIAPFDLMKIHRGRKWRQLVPTLAAYLFLREESTDVLMEDYDNVSLVWLEEAGIILAQANKENKGETGQAEDCKNEENMAVIGEAEERAFEEDMIRAFKESEQEAQGQDETNDAVESVEQASQDTNPSDDENDAFIWKLLYETAKETIDSLSPEKAQELRALEDDMLGRNKKE